VRERWEDRIVAHESKLLLIPLSDIGGAGLNYPALGRKETIRTEESEICEEGFGERDVFHHVIDMSSWVQKNRKVFVIPSAS
jgi:hypothetical protein